jgi:hypothetical protein
MLLVVAQRRSAILRVLHGEPPYPHCWTDKQLQQSVQTFSSVAEAFDNQNIPFAAASNQKQSFSGDSLSINAGISDSGSGGQSVPKTAANAISTSVTSAVASGRLVIELCPKIMHVMIAIKFIFVLVIVWLHVFFSSWGIMSGKIKLGKALHDFTEA